MALTSRSFNNCLFFAAYLYFKRGRKGRIVWRKSFYTRFPHFMYKEKNHIVHYVPRMPVLKTSPPPLFKGRVKWGDK